MPMNKEAKPPGELPLMCEEPSFLPSSALAMKSMCPRDHHQEEPSCEAEHGTPCIRKLELRPSQSPSPSPSPSAAAAAAALLSRSHTDNYTRKEPSLVMGSPPWPGSWDIPAAASSFPFPMAARRSFLREDHPDTFNGYHHPPSKLNSSRSDNNNNRRCLVGETKPNLHHWRPNTASSSDGDFDSDDDEDDDDRTNMLGGSQGGFMGDGGCFQRAPPHMLSTQNWAGYANDEAARRPAQHFPAYHAAQSSPAANHEFHRTIRAAASEQGMSTRIGKSSRKTPQMLSPSFLYPHDINLRKFGQSKSFFTLEKPYDDGQYPEEARNAATEASIGHSEPWYHPPIGSEEECKPSKRKVTKLKPPLRHNIHLEGCQTSSMLGQGRGGFWEVCPDPNGMVSSRGGENSCITFANPNVPQKYQYARQDVDLPHHPKKMMTPRSKGGSGSKEKPLARRQYSNARRRANAEAEPAHPLQNELDEEYSGTSEASFADDGDGRIEPKEPQASIEGQNIGTMVKVTEKEATLQLATTSECKELALCDSKPRSLCQKYRPKAFEEVVGQRVVMQALSNAILKEKIAPVYLFQGSRGTGKTSAARIFAAALVCQSTNGTKPCSRCQDCVGVAMGTSSEVKEVDAASNNGIEKVKALLEKTISSTSLSRYKVFIIDECHVLTPETWNALLKMLEEPPASVVFILITTDPDRLPRTALSRCQKFPFPKIKESDIVKRLHDLAGMENLEVDTDTLQLIASRSEGSLRDAEMTLDQLSLLGEQIDDSIVYELVGSASDERMLNLLDCALRADAIGTVKRVKELIDSGVEPLSLMSRLATLITDILSGSFSFTEKQRKGFFKKETLSEKKLECLRQAMKILSEAEKQVRVSNDRTTWLTAALLQLGPDPRICTTSFPASCAGTSVTQSPVALDDNEGADFEYVSSGRRTWEENTTNGPNTSSEPPCASTKVQREAPSYQPTLVQLPQTQAEKRQCHQHQLDDLLNPSHILSSAKLDDIWYQMLQRCWPLTLRQLLNTHGKLISISLTDADAVINLEVNHPEHKARCERSQKSIANAFESVLGFPVDVMISLASLSISGEEPDIHTCEHHNCPIKERTFASSWKAETDFLDESTSYWPRGNYNIHNGAAMQGIDSSYSGREVLDALALENNPSVALPAKSRSRHSSLDGFVESIYDARQSCDAETHKMEDGSSKIIRALTMRTRIRSLSNSNPTSPERRGSSRFNISSRASVNLHKQRDYSCLSGNGASSDASEEVAGNSNNVAPKRNKLKEAAGSFARFFKGSK